MSSSHDYYDEEYEKEDGSGFCSFSHIALAVASLLPDRGIEISSLSISKDRSDSEYQLGIKLSFPAHEHEGKADPLMLIHRNAIDSRGNTYKSAHLYMNNQVDSRLKAFADSKGINTSGLKFSSSYFYAPGTEKISTSAFFKTASSLKVFVDALQRDAGFTIDLNKIPPRLAVAVRDGVDFVEAAPEPGEHISPYK